MNNWSLNIAQGWGKFWWRIHAIWHALSWWIPVFHVQTLLLQSAISTELSLDIIIKQRTLTIRSQPTTWPPPMPSPCRIWTGKFTQRTMMGYTLTVLCVDSLVLSAYNIKQSGAALRLAGRRDWLHRHNHCTYTQILNTVTYLNVPPMISCPWFTKEPLEIGTVVLVDTLHIPYKMRCKERVIQEIKGPVPYRSRIYLKHPLLLLVGHRNVMSSELVNSNLGSQMSIAWYKRKEDIPASTWLQHCLMPYEDRPHFSVWYGCRPVLCAR